MEWQDTQYVLGLFSNALSTARRAYSRFVRSGIEQGRRPDLTGGGLLRSHGGWTGIKALRATAARLVKAGGVLFRTVYLHYSEFGEIL